MGRVKGSRNMLVAITFDTIGELAGGIAGDVVAGRDAQRPASMHSVANSTHATSILCWHGSTLVGP